MGACVATIHGNQRCEQQTKPGYKFCEEHKNRPKAIAERENKALDNVVDAEKAFTPQFVENNEPVGNTPAVPRDKTPTQRNVYEKTMDVLDRALEWEEKTWGVLMALPQSEMRYTDKAGAEQLRSEVSMNERAQDRTIRAVTAIAKLDIDAQSVNINKMMRELIQSVVVKALTRAGLENEQINQIRLYIAEEFQRAANEGS